MVDASSLVIPAFHDVLGDVMAHGHTHYWLYGGRGSTKPSFISVCVVLLLLAHPEANAVIVRRFSNTLRDSVFSQMTWAIAALGLDRWFRARISPMELTYLPTGQRIVFRGADDPLKLKGVKFARGYAAVVWFEELDQFDGIDAVQSILNSLRAWNFFETPDSVTGFSNTGGFGIDGGVSSLIGASFANREKLYFGIIGDLAFFYDMNVIGNRHVGNNVRIMLINNGRGTEFRLYNHPANRFGNDADPYMAAAGHFGSKSHRLIKHYAEDLGYEYMSASDKEE